MTLLHLATMTGIALFAGAVAAPIHAQLQAIPPRVSTIPDEQLDCPALMAAISTEGEAMTQRLSVLPGMLKDMAVANPARPDAGAAAASMIPFAGLLTGSGTKSRKAADDATKRVNEAQAKLQASLPQQGRMMKLAALAQARRCGSDATAPTQGN